MTANNDKNRTYSVVYTPKVTGMHKVRLQPAVLGHKGAGCCFLTVADGTETSFGPVRAGQWIWTQLIEASLSLMS